MGNLDGRWKVERIAGLLPPLLGVEKRIRGDRGETRVGAAIGVPFRVEGRALRYRWPLSGFVDDLEGSGDELAGRATLRGRKFGRFRMTRLSAPPS